MPKHTAANGISAHIDITVRLPCADLESTEPIQCTPAHTRLPPGDSNRVPQTQIYAWPDTSKSGKELWTSRAAGVRELPRCAVNLNVEDVGEDEPADAGPL
jgi:hypothetical protein